jgi:hypothetical protein
LILPRGHGLGDHLAQWDDNLVPDYWTVDGKGRRSYLRIGWKSNQVETFAGGFAVSERTGLQPAGDKGKPDSPGAVIDHRVMAALPDGRTVVFAACGRAGRAVARLGTMDLNWRFVRSIFSDMQRSVFYEGGQDECRHVVDVATPWFNVDGMMSVISIGKPARVTCELFGEVDEEGVPVAEQDPFGTHAGQTVRLGVCSLKPRDYRAGEDIFTAAVAFVTDTDAAGAGQLAGECRKLAVAQPARAWQVVGRDGTPYAVVVNFSDEATDADIPGWSPGNLLTPQSATVTRRADRSLVLRIAPRGCAVLAR